MTEAQEVCPSVLELKPLEDLNVQTSHATVTESLTHCVGHAHRVCLQKTVSR